MTRRTFADQLDAAAGQARSLPVAALAALLRRAAIRIRSTGETPLDPAWEDALATAAAEMKLGRGDLVRTIVKDWLIANTYLPEHMLEEDSEVDGRG